MISTYTEKETLKAMAIYVYYHCKRKNVFALYVPYALFSSYMYRDIVMWACINRRPMQTKVAIASGYTAVAVSLVSHLLLVGYH